jgi:hypothetical protein
MLPLMPTFSNPQAEKPTSLTSKLERGITGMEMSPARRFSKPGWALPVNASDLLEAQSRD